MAARLEVGEQPHLLEGVFRHDVRLVDQNHDAAPGAIERDEVLLELAQRHGAPLRQLELQIVGDRMQDFLAGERGRGEIDGRHFGRQALHQHAAEHGLAAAHLARHLDDAFVVQHGVGKRFERRAALRALEEEIGMRCDAERRLVQAEVLEIQRHGYLSSPPLFMPLLILL